MAVLSYSPRSNQSLDENVVVVDSPKQTVRTVSTF